MRSTWKKHASRCRNKTKAFAKQIALFEDEGKRYENYAKMLEDGADYATLQKTFAEMSYARFPSTKRTDDPMLTETKANVKLIRDEAKKIFTEKSFRNISPFQAPIWNRP